MHALPRSPISDTHFFISGTVTIDPSAAIAPGVLIQAEPGAQVVVHAGVCIGQGSVIHAASGTVEIAEGATLGTGVLIFGACQVGAGACVGASVTVVGCTVGPGQIVPANSILTTLEIPTVGIPAPTSSGAPQSASTPPPKIDQAEVPIDDPWIDSPPEPEVSPAGEAGASAEVTAEEVHTAEINTAEISVKTQRVVYGKSSLDQILTMMFPHRQALNSDSSSNQPNSS